MDAAGGVQALGKGRHGQRRDGQHGQNDDHARGLGGEALRAVAQSPEQEGQPQNEQAVAQDRADQHRLHHGDIALLQGEDAHEQLREVAQRGLQHARGARPQPLPHLLGRLPD